MGKTGRGKSEWGKDSVRKPRRAKHEAFLGRAWSAHSMTATWEGGTKTHPPWVSGASLCSLYLNYFCSTYNLLTYHTNSSSELSWKCFWPSSGIIQTAGQTTLSPTTLFQTRGTSPNVTTTLHGHDLIWAWKNWSQHFTLSLYLSLS